MPFGDSPIEGIETEKQIINKEKDIELKGHVLIIDDEPMVRAAAMAILNNKGMKTSEAVNGDQGLGMFLENPSTFSCIILDLKMPGMPSEDVFKNIRQADHDIPIIISSGYSETTITGTFAQMENVQLLPKPYQASELVELMRLLLDKNE